MSNDIIATVPNFTHIQVGAVYRGKSGKELKIEFKDDQKPAVIKEKLVEVKPDGSTVFRKAQNAMAQILSLYLASFGKRLEDLEHLSYKKALFLYYYKAQKIVFEPLSLQDGVETAMLRLETYAFKHSGAPFHTYVIPYYIQKRNVSDGGIVVDDLQALKALAAQHQGLTRIHIVDMTLYQFY